MSSTAFGTANNQTINLWAKALMKEARKSTRFTKFMKGIYSWTRPLVSLENEDGSWATFELTEGDVIHWKHHNRHIYGPIEHFSMQNQAVVSKLKANWDEVSIGMESGVYIVPAQWIFAVERSWE